MVKCTHKPMFVRFSGIICCMFASAHPGGIFVVNVAGPFSCQNTVKYGFPLSASKRRNVSRTHGHISRNTRLTHIHTHTRGIWELLKVK